jgi:Ca-activated chloride channel homolog
MDAQVWLERTMVAFEQGDTVHVMVELEAPVPAPAARQPLDAIAVIDRSGSMTGAPLDAAKHAVEQLLRMLGPDDRLGVVVYDDEVDLVLGLTRHDIATAAAAVRAIDSGGSTNLAGGWLKAFEVLASDGRPEALRKVLLLTDGLANVGLTQPSALAGLCSGGQRAGVGTSTVGLGDSFDEELLAAMADAGHGNDHYAASTEDLPGIFATEFEDFGLVVAHNVSIEVRPDDRVQVIEIYGGRPPVAVEHGFQIALGDAYGGERRRVVLALGVPGLDAMGPVTICEIVVRYATVGEGASLHSVTMPVVVNVVDPSAVDNPDAEVTEEILMLRAAKARLDARQKLLEGDGGEAASSLRATAADLLAFAAACPDRTRAAADADDLLRAADEMDEVPTPHASKVLYSQSRTTMRGRRPGR